MLSTRTSPQRSGRGRSHAGSCQVPDSHLSTVKKAGTLDYVLVGRFRDQTGCLLRTLELAGSPGSELQRELESDGEGEASRLSVSARAIEVYT
jgi:hypothetical protein